LRRGRLGQRDVRQEQEYGSNSHINPDPEEPCR
jgi:hypothetical protein